MHTTAESAGRRISALTILTSMVILGLLVILPGCAGEKVEKTDAQPPPDTTAATLNERLAELRAELNAELPIEVQDIGRDQIEKLLESGILDAVLTVGDTAPDFGLPNAVGQTVASDDLLARGPVVLAFYRGGW